MGAAYFYHLTMKPLEATLPMLLSKARGVGWRVVVRGTDVQRLEWLDEKLWLGADDGFLPHGLAGGAHEAAQPILLTADQHAANAPHCVMTIDGADVDPAEVNAMERVCVLFDGNDPSAVQRARDQWRLITQAGCSAQYWSEEIRTLGKESRSLIPHS